MDGVNGGNSVQQMAGAIAQHQVVPVLEAMGAAVGVQENMNSVGGGVAFSMSGGRESDSIPKRKRGRPRKQQEVEVQRELVSMTAESSVVATPQKRGRGRPKGSGKCQSLMTSLSGNALLESAGSNFTPHTMTIQKGENIVQRIGSFTQKASESVCILSASGSVSSAEILRPGSFGGVLRYEGQFEIVSLSGSYANNGTAATGVNGKNCLLSMQLANPDGALFGGAVGSSLIAGGPTQLVIATFRQKTREKEKEIEKAKVKRPDKVEATTPLQMTANSQPSAAEPSSLQQTVHVSANTIDAVEKFINSHDNHASPQPFNWTSLQSSASVSQHAISDFNTGVH